MNCFWIFSLIYTMGPPTWSTVVAETTELAAALFQPPGAALIFTFTFILIFGSTCPVPKTVEGYTVVVAVLAAADFSLGMLPLWRFRFSFPSPVDLPCIASFLFLLSLASIVLLLLVCFRLQIAICKSWRGEKGIHMNHHQGLVIGQGKTGGRAEYEENLLCNVTCEPSTLVDRNVFQLFLQAKPLEGWLSRVTHMSLLYQTE